MAQGFDCGCGASVSLPHLNSARIGIASLSGASGADKADGQKCLGRIQGAKHLSMEQLEETGWVNEHIREMKRAQKE